MTSSTSQTKASTGLVVERAGLSSVPADEWDGLLRPGRRLLGHAFLEAASAVELEGFAFGALLARREKLLVAGAPAYPYRLDLAAFIGGATRRVASALRRVLPGLLELRVFELGWPSILSEPLVGREDAGVLRAMAEAALAQAADHNADLTVVRDFAADDGTPATALRPLGFEPCPLAVDYTISLTGFGTYEAYVAALRSDYRRALKRLTRGRSVTFERVGDFAPLARELAALWRAASERAKALHRESLGEGFFARLARVPGTSALLVRDADGTATRFALLHDDRPLLRPLYYGGPPRVEHDLAYVKMLHEFMRIGILEGFGAIDLGPTTGAPKLALGARPRLLCAWVKHRSAIVQRGLVSLLCGPLAPREPGPRHVFRTERDQGRLS